MDLCWCTGSILDNSVLVYGGRRVLADPGGDRSRYCMGACFHYMVSHGRMATWRSTSLSRSNAWPSSSTWNPSAFLTLFFFLFAVVHFPVFLRSFRFDFFYFILFIYLFFFFLSHRIIKTFFRGYVWSVCSSWFAWLTDEADFSVILTLLRGAFLGKCDD